MCGREKRVGNEWLNEWKEEGKKEGRGSDNISIVIMRIADDRKAEQGKYT